MLRLSIGIFFVLHGLVHLLYAGHSRGLFELSDGLAWPSGSLAFSKLIGDGATRGLATALMALAAIGFITVGGAVFFRQAWWRPVTVGVALFSSAAYLLLWDGGLQKLPDKGGVGLLINLAILAALLIFQWPDL
jgi:hypothetical protein